MNKKVTIDIPMSKEKFAALLDAWARDPKALTMTPAKGKYKRATVRITMEIEE